MSTPGFSAPVRQLPYSPDDVRIPGSAPVPADPDRMREPVDPSVYVNEWTRPLPDPHRTFAGPGYETPPMPTSPLAVISLICGLLGFLLVPAIPAIVLGHLGLLQTRRNTHTGRGLAVGGMVLGYAVVAVVILWLVAWWILTET